MGMLRALLKAVTYVITAAVVTVAYVIMKLAGLKGGAYAIVPVAIAVMVVGEVLQLARIGRWLGIAPGDDK